MGKHCNQINWLPITFDYFLLIRIWLLCDVKHISVCWPNNLAEVLTQMYTHSHTFQIRYGAENLSSDRISPQKSFNIQFGNITQNLCPGTLYVLTRSHTRFLRDPFIVSWLLCQIWCAASSSFYRSFVVELTSFIVLFRVHLTQLKVVEFNWLCSIKVSIEFFIFVCTNFYLLLSLFSNMKFDLSVYILLVCVMAIQLFTNGKLSVK